MWSFGSLAGLYLSLQILTGILLVIFYTPQTDLAFNSVEVIMRSINNGWLIRYTHSNIASFFFIFVYIHIIRALYYNSYFSPRRSLWYTGLVIFILIIMTAFIGYVLPWGQISFWGATVITNLFGAIPVFGKDIAMWLWGGFTIDNATLVRFFSLHYLLPFLISVIVLLHLYFLHIYGSSSPIGIFTVYDKITFLPYFYVKDFFILIVSLIFFTLINFFYPNLLGHADNYIKANALITPVHIVPEWYFLYFYAILRSIPNKLGGVICIAGAIFILFIISWLQLLVYTKKTIKLMLLKYNFKKIFIYFISTIVLLGWIGAKPIEFPFVFIGIVCIFLYFFFLGIGLLSIYIYDSIICYNEYKNINKRDFKIIETYMVVKPIFQSNLIWLRTNY